MTGEGEVDASDGDAGNQSGIVREVDGGGMSTRQSSRPLRQQGKETGLFRTIHVNTCNICFVEVK